MKLFVIKHWPVLTLLFIWLLLCLTNYTPGTYLSGWDTLHPEFNYELNLQRLIHGVFRAEQGLGAVAAHAHMADLPRVLLLLIFDIFLPTSMVRYAYVFLCLLVGPLGIFYFLHYIFDRTPHPDPLPQERRKYAFLGALFYMLNIGTMQQFVVPFEMFTTLYAALPWLFLFATKYLFETNKKQRRRLLLYFAVTTLLATPMAYAPTLWYAHFLLFSLYVFAVIIAQLRPHPDPLLIGEGVKHFQKIKKAIILLFITIMINSFWLLPNLYFVINHSHEVENARINQLFSPQAFLHNKAYGDLGNIVRLRSFLFDWNVYAGNNRFESLLTPWITHTEKLPVQLIQYGLAGIAGIGLLNLTLPSPSRRGKNVALGLIPPLSICLFFLINDNPPTGWLYNLLQTHLPLFKEAFRFPHTKFSIHFIFIFTIFFALSVQALTLTLPLSLRRGKRSQIISVLLCLVLLSLLIVQAIPSFTGQLISPYMRTKIPDAYFQMFTWFDTQPDGRVANLPIHSFWGWEYYEWSDQVQDYTWRSQAPTGAWQGAGFMWFGIKQPVLARDFDRWNPHNEQYYNDMSYAIYKQDPGLLQNALQKYNIKYLLVDKSIVSPQLPTQVLFTKETESLLAKQPYIKKSAQFDTFLSIYQVELPQKHTLSSAPNPIIPLDSIELRTDGVHIPLPQNTLTESQLLHEYLTREHDFPSTVSMRETNNALTVNLAPQSPLENSHLAPIPLTTFLPVSSKQTTYTLSINKNLFPITNPTDQHSLVLGTTQLHNTLPNPIALYATIDSQQIIPDFSKLNYNLHPCTNKQPNQQFSMESTPHGFIVEGENTHICLTLPLNQIVPLEMLANTEVLLQPTFAFTIPADTVLPSSLCLLDLHAGRCTHNTHKDIHDLPLTFSVPTKSIETIGLQFSIDTTHQSHATQAIFDDVSFTLTPPSFSAEIPANSIQPATARTDAKTETSDIHIPFSGNSTLSHDISISSQTPVLCELAPLQKSEQVSKKLIEQHASFIHYTAENGVLCDHFSYPNLSHSTGYLLFVRSRNISGLPLTLCATNYYSKRCDIYSYLSDSPNFTTKTFLLPPHGKGQGYDLNIGSLGINKSPAVNDLESILIVPIPYYWLTAIHTIPELQTNQTIQTNNYSYEKGWKAYANGKEINQHVMRNGWANGWVTDNTQVTFVFIPQYLEYFGFLLLFGTFVWITASFKTL